MAYLFLLLLVLVLVRLLTALVWPALLKRAEGRRAEAMLVSQFGEIQADPVLQEIGQRLLAAGGGERASFGVLSGPIRSAVALPNGRILIWQGLLDELREDRDLLAGALARQLGHLRLDHFFDRVMLSATTRFVISPLGRGWARRSLQSAAATAIARGFTPAEERDADDDALQRMAAADFDPRALPRLLEHLARHVAHNNIDLRRDLAERARRIREALGPGTITPSHHQPGEPQQAGSAPLTAPASPAAALPDNVIPFPLRRRASGSGSGDA